MKPLHTLGGGLLASAAIIAALSLVAAQVPVVQEAQADTDLATTRAAPAATTSSGGLHLQITDVEPGEGSIIVLVYDNARAYSAYDVSNVAGYAELPTSARTLETQFGDLTTPPYAVALFHDANGDYDLNMVAGYPLEGYGTSGARSWYHEPSFAEASVEGGSVSVKMYYPR